VAASLKKLDSLDLSGASARANKLAKDLMGGVAHTLVRRGVVVGGAVGEQQPATAAQPAEYNPDEYEVVK
jgi:hypothetical protein